MKLMEYVLKNKKGFLIAIGFIFLISIIVVVISINFLETTVGTIFFTIGITLASGMIVSVFDLFRNAADEISKSNIYEILNSGIDKIYDRRDIEEYYELVKKAKKIDVVGYSLRGFMQSHKETILELAKKKDFQMRIVIVDPESEISRNREELENKAYNNLFSQNFKMICSTFKGHKNIKIYKIKYALGSMIFRIDDVMYVGPHFMKTESRVTFTMKIKSNSWAFGEFEEEFDHMCSLSEEIV